MSGPIDDYLAELAQRLQRVPEVASRLVEEAREHLEESSADGRARGLDEARAEVEAVARFGSARSLARALAPRRVGCGPRTLGLALALSLFAGLAFAQVAGPPELIALVTRPNAHTAANAPLSGLGTTRLVSLDPTTRAPVGAEVALPATG